MNESGVRKEPHPHAIYTCRCGHIISQCRCAAINKQEIVVQESCESCEPRAVGSKMPDPIEVEYLERLRQLKRLLEQTINCAFGLYFTDEMEDILRQVEEKLAPPVTVPAKVEFERNKRRCPECDSVFDTKMIREASNPFRLGDTIFGCPRCESVILPTPVCDEPGCRAPVSCGTPVGSDYRMTCSEHRP